MKIGVNDGHTLKGAGTGAVGIIKEGEHTRLVGEEVRRLLKERGNTVYNCTVDYANTVNESLSLVVQQANREDLDWFIAIHFNAASGQGRGVEVYTYEGRQYQDALDVCTNIAATLGIPNRGVKAGTGLYVIRRTKAKSMLIEVCFVDSDDADKYLAVGHEAVAKAIVDALDNHIIATPTVNSNSNNTTVVSKEDYSKYANYVGNRCKELQEKLISLGYDCGGYGADGKFGKGTYKSLIKFQKDYNLKVDGLAGEATFDKLDELTGANNSNTSFNFEQWVRDLQSECNNQGFSNQKVDGDPGDKTLEGCPTLRKGVEGNITKLAQERLISLGYDLGKYGADGDFETATYNAVVKFQKDNGLTPDGIVGQNTWRKLLNL